MVDAFGEFVFLNKLVGGDDKWPETMEELVQGWIAYWTDKFASGKNDEEFFWACQCAYDLCAENANLGIELVLAVLEKKPGAEILPVFAAGPLEEVLAYHGAAVIDRVEADTRRSPQFQHLLGGVCQNKMPDDIWLRVLKAAPERW